MTAPFAIVIGASAGGVGALLELIQQLPGPLNAAVGVVLHIGKRHSVLPELLRARGARAGHARDGEPLESGRIYVAPPDYHLLFTEGRVKVTRGPLENHSRPAVDPLFRSVAISWRERAIGVVLSGDLDDGTAGLAAIKQCGGVAIVQNPASALEPGMPCSAIANVQVDYRLDVPDIARTLYALTLRPHDAPATSTPPPEVLREHNPAQEMGTVRKKIEHLSGVATHSALTCPECGGGLWELNDSRPLRYRCHAGHAYSAASLARSQRQLAEQALWSSVRALRERELLLRRLANVAQATGDGAQAAVGRNEADRVGEQARRMTVLVEDELQHGKVLAKP